MIVPKSPRRMLSAWLGPWSWYGQTPTDSGGLPRVGELLARRDEPADAREPAHVRAVVVRRVAHAVRVHRVRRAELLVAVAEVHAQDVADLGLERRPGHRRRAERPAEALAVELVDDRGERARARGSRAGPSSRRGRSARERPSSTRAGLDPVLAHPAPRGGHRLRELLAGLTRLGGGGPGHRGGGLVGPLDVRAGPHRHLRAPQCAYERSAGRDLQKAAPAETGRRVGVLQRRVIPCIRGR